MALAKKNEATPEETPEETQAEETTAAAVESEALDAPDPETENPEEQADDPGTAVTTTVDKPPATTDGGKNQALGALADSGFGGLDIDWTSFRTIVLDGNNFCTGDDAQELGVDSILVRIMGTRKRFVLKTPTKDDKEEPELAYSYDISADLANPESEVSKKVQLWKEELGVSYEVKEYIEVMAIVEDDACSLDTQMVLLQIPPTSRGRFSGFCAQNLMVKKSHPNEYLTKIMPGVKITKSAQPFYPWAFEYVDE